MKKSSRREKTERIETYGNIELRYKNGELDELVMSDSAGKCIFHLEWMHDNCYWFQLNGTKKNYRH